MGRSQSFKDEMIFEESVWCAKFFDLFSTWLKTRTVHVAVIHHHTFAVVVFNFANKSTHGGLMVLRSEGHFAKRGLKVKPPECSDHALGIGALGFLHALGNGLDGGVAHDGAQARIVAKALLIGA